MTELPPYAQMLGMIREGKGFRMPFSPHLIGSPGRLHGGVIAGLMEVVANITLREALGDTNKALKPISITVDYMREGAMEECYAEAEILRLGRRIANVQVESWQSDRSRIISTARINILIQ